MGVEYGVSRAATTPQPSLHAVHGGRRVTRELYDRMFSAYLANPSERSVASACGVNRETARRAINEGYPRHGWAPLAERAREIHRQAAEAEDYDIVEAHRATLRALRDYKARFLAEFAGASISGNDVSLAQLEKIARLEGYLLGAADHRVEMKSASAFFLADITPEDRERILAEGARIMAEDARGGGARGRG